MHIIYPTVYCCHYRSDFVTDLKVELSLLAVECARDKKGQLWTMRGEARVICYRTSF